MSNIGDINYSVNINDFYNILKNCMNKFIRYYIVITIISIMYLYTIRFQKQYIEEPKNTISHYFKTLSEKSPLAFFSFCNIHNNKDTFIGFTNSSYIFLIITYLISLFCIFELLLKNFLYSFYLNIIQLNPNNNPYNNTNCVTKITESPSVSINKYYIAIFSLSFIFIIPFFIQVFMHSFKYDNYDIKKNILIKYFIFILLVSPIFIIGIFKILFYKKLQIFDNLQKFIEKNDFHFIKKIQKDFYFNFFNTLPFLFILFIFCYYIFLHVDYRFHSNTIYYIYFILFFLLFIFIPLFYIYQTFSILFNNNSYDNVLENIEKNGIQNIYDLFVKYNYPCFQK
jgi:hypothetical protein